MKRVVVSMIVILMLGVSFANAAQRRVCKACASVKTEVNVPAACDSVCAKDTKVTRVQVTTETARISAAADMKQIAKKVVSLLPRKSTNCDACSPAKDRVKVRVKVRDRVKVSVN